MAFAEAQRREVVSGTIRRAAVLLMRFSTITSSHRARLRSLRAEFERAFDVVADLTDRTSDSFIEAGARYRAWITAMDAVAIQLLDDIDRFEEGIANSADEQRLSRASAPPLNASEAGDVFAEISEAQRLAEIIGTPDADDEACFPRPLT